MKLEQLPASARISRRVVSKFIHFSVYRWAYGVLLWEIFSLGASPYPTVPHERLFEALREGHRMDKPPHSSQDMYAIMRQCWQYHAAQRATFSEIVEELERILSGIVIDVSRPK